MAEQATSWAQHPGLWAAGALLWLALSVVSRLLTDKPLFAARRAGCLFAEGWASARIGTGLLARLGTARNCMHVQVSGDELRVHPHFPFTLGFMPELYDLDQVVALAAVRSAAIVSGHRAKVVELRYTLANGADGQMLLFLRHAEAFIERVLEQAPKP